MTFMATYNGRLESGYRKGKARKKIVDGATYYDWPQPWAFRCNSCGRDYPYGCVMLSTDRRTLCEPQVRELNGRQEHICAECENGFVQEPLFIFR